MKLLLDPRLENRLDADEIAYLVIHDAKSDSLTNFNDVVEAILDYRSGDLSAVNLRKSEEKHKAFYNIANTLVNYLFLTQLICLLDLLQ